jgi:membrane associated rhomboid family serine protease
MREASVGFQCPECVAEGRRTQRPARTAFGGGSLGERGYVTLTLMAVNVIMLLASLASARNAGVALAGGGLGGLLGGETPLMHQLAVVGLERLNNGQLVPTGVANGEYYRLFTAMFMHYGVLHIATNMWVLWVLGRALEAALGPLRFVALYLVAGIGGNVAAYVWQPEALSAGASTAIFGLLAALVIVLRRMRRDISTIIPMIVLNLVITFAVPNISIAGHLGGFVTGGAVCLGIAYAPRTNRTLVQILTFAGALVVLILLTVVKTAALQG